MGKIQAEKREKVIKIRVTEEEYTALKKSSTKPRLAEWMRDSCLGIKPKKQHKTSPLDPALLRQLSSIGNNLNQIARQINASKTSVINHIYLLSVLNAIQGEIREIKDDSQNARKG